MATAGSAEMPNMEIFIKMEPDKASINEDFSEETTSAGCAAGGAAGGTGGAGGAGGGGSEKDSDTTELTDDDEDIKASEGSIQIIVKASDSGKNITLDVELSDTIRCVKGMIQAKEGVPRNQQRLIFQNQQLEDEHNLLDVNIKDGSVVTMSMRGRGGGKRARSSIERVIIVPEDITVLSQMHAAASIVISMDPENITAEEVMTGLSVEALQDLQEVLAAKHTGFETKVKSLLMHTVLYKTVEEATGIMNIVKSLIEEKFMQGIGTIAQIKEAVKVELKVRERQQQKLQQQQQQQQQQGATMMAE